jgi:hypothetical protein
LVRFPRSTDPFAQSVSVTVCPAVTVGGLVPVAAGQTGSTALGVRATLAAGQTVCPIDEPVAHEQKTATAKPARKFLEVIPNIAISLSDIRQMG